MKTKELIEKLKTVKTSQHQYDVPVRLSDSELDEVIQKLRQLEDIKKMLREMWDLSSERDDIQYDITEILGDMEVYNFQEGDINYGRKE